MDYNICSGPEITRKTLLISYLYRSYTSSKTFESDFRQLFVLKVFNRSISWPKIILHLLHFEFITTFSLFLAKLVKICVPRGRPARVLFPLINNVTAAPSILGSKKRSYEYYG